MEHNLQKIIEKLKVPQSNPGLLQGKMGSAVFFFHYARCMNCPYEEDYANRLIDEITENLPEIKDLGYSNGLSGIGAGIEYLVQQGFIEGDTNEILSDFDRVIEVALSSFRGSIDVGNGITGYGKYCVSRMRNPNNFNRTNPHATFITGLLTKIVDFLSTPFGAYGDIYSIIDFLPEVIALDIHTEKAAIYLNYAIDLLETKVNEDHFFGKYPNDFNPLIAAVILFRAAGKTGDNNLRRRAMCFLGKYEPGYRQYLSEKRAIQWAFLYKMLWKMEHCSVYGELSVRWEEKIESDGFDFEDKNLASAGMMLYAIREQNSDGWLNLFPLFFCEI